MSLRRRLMMAEYQGDKFVVGREGGDYYSSFYVEWLEDCIERLEFERRILIKIVKKRDKGIERHLNNLWEAHSASE